MSNKRQAKIKFENNEKENLKNNEKMKVFLNWLKSNGVIFDDIYFKLYSNDERGVYSKNNINRNERLMFIPRDALITNIEGENTQWGQKYKNSKLFQSHGFLLRKITFVILYILSTIDDPNSKFKPYYDILPRILDNFPIFWDKDELQYLKGSDFLNTIRERKEGIEKDYIELCQVIPELKTMFTLDDFMWCRTIVGSRNFGLDIDNQQCTVMVPLADMLNHYRPAETKWFYDNQKKGYAMEALEFIPKDVQIMDSYGSKSNYQFLIHYGFCIEDSPETDRLSEVTLEVDKNTFKLTNQYYDNLLMAYLRRKVANNDEKNQLTTYSGKINERNEMAMQALLSFICRQKLSTYLYDNATTKRKFNQCKPFSPERNIFYLILSEQKILLNYIEKANKFILKL